MIAKLEIPMWDAGWNAMTDEHWQDFARIVGIRIRDNNKAKPEYPPKGMVCDVRAALLACDTYGIKLEISSVPGLYALEGGDDLATVRQKLEKINTDHVESVIRQVAAGDTREATIVQVTIPDHALLMIDEVEVMEDACTDALRERLDSGWRVMAVCPPNGQRRPDYVIGRTPKARALAKAGPA